MQATLLVGFALQQLGSSGSKTEPEQRRFSAEASSASTVTLSQTQTVWLADLELGAGGGRTNQRTAFGLGRGFTFRLAVRAGSAIP